MSDVSEDVRRLRQLDFFEGREFAGIDGAPPRSDELMGRSRSPARGRWF